MSDALPIDDVKAEYIRLRVSGADPALAMEQAKAAVQSRLDAKPGKGVSFVRGAAQGGSLGFEDEIAGALGAAASSLGILPNHEKLGIGDAYRQYRDEARAADSEAQAENPKTFIAGQFVGGAATAPVLPLGGAATTAARAAGVGALYGAAGGLGASKADLTEGDVGRAAADTAIGAGVGAVTGAAAYGAGKLARSIWRKARGQVDPVDQIAGDAVKESAATPATQGAPESAPLSPKAAKAAVGEAKKAALAVNRPSSIGAGQTVATTAKQSRQIEREASQAIGEDFKFFPDQSTGTRSAALARRRAMQFDPTMDEAQALAATQDRQATKYLNTLVDHVASDPSRLGSEQMVRGVGEALRAEGKALYQARSAAAGPLYDAAEAAGGGVDVGGILQAVKDEISPFQGGKISGQLRGIVSKLEQMGAGGGVSIKEANGLRKLMGATIRGENSFLDGVDMDVQGKIARRIMGAVDDAFDQAVGTESGQGVDLLRQANSVWREHSQKIDNALTDTVMRLIAKSGTETAESIPSQMLKMEPAQVAGVFKIVRERSPGDASDLLATMIEEALTAGGKPIRGAPMAEAAGVQRLGAQGAIKALEKIEPLIHAASPDNKTRFAVARMYSLLDRMRHGPNIQGSDTAAKAYGPVADMGRKVVGAVSDKAAKAMEYATQVADKITKSNASIAEALSNRHGIETFNAALELLIAQQQRKPIPPALAVKLLQSASQAGLLSAPRSASESVVNALGPRPPMAEADQQQAPRYATAGGQ